MKKIITAIFITLCITVTAQVKNNSGNQINTRLTSIEQKVDTLTAEVEKVKETVDSGNDALEKAESVYETAKEFMNIMKDSIFLFIAILSLLFTIIAFFGVKKYVKREFKKVLRKNNKVLLEMVKGYTREKLLLDNSKILIINKTATKTDPRFITILNKFGNTPEIKETLDLEIDIAMLKKFDVVILENIDKQPWDFNDNLLMEKLLKIARETCKNDNAFLYYGRKDRDGKFIDRIEEYNHLINFTNQPSTLFSSLVNLLDYRQILGKS